MKTIAKCRPWCHSNLHQNAWGLRSKWNGESMNSKENGNSFWCHKPKLRSFSINTFINIIWTSPTRSSRIIIPTKMHKGGMLLPNIILIFVLLILYGLEFKIQNLKSKNMVWNYGFRGLKLSFWIVELGFIGLRLGF